MKENSRNQTIEKSFKKKQYSTIGENFYNKIETEYKIIQDKEKVTETLDYIPENKEQKYTRNSEINPNEYDYPDGKDTGINNFNYKFLDITELNEMQNRINEELENRKKEIKEAQEEKKAQIEAREELKEMLNGDTSEKK